MYLFYFNNSASSNDIKQLPPRINPHHPLYLTLSHHRHLHRLWGELCSGYEWIGWCEGHFEDE